jgi:hypothetical protein
MIIELRIQGLELFGLFLHLGFARERGPFELVHFEESYFDSNRSLVYLGCCYYSGLGCFGFVCGGFAQKEGRVCEVPIQ